MCSQEKEDATQLKTFKHACYKSKEKRSRIDAWSQQPNYHKQTSFLVNAMQDENVMIIRNIQKTFFMKQC